MNRSIILEEFKNYMIEEISKYKTDDKIKEILEYVMISNGKYIRPLLFLCYLDDKKINYKNYMNLAMTIEMIHTYSLIHDDLPAIDNDDMRRGKLSCHKKYGEGVAIIIGDMLITDAFSKLVDNKEVDSELKVRMIKKTVKAAGIEGMIYGQYIDIKNKADNIEILNEMHILKTAKMITLPLTLATMVAKSEEELPVEKLGNDIGLLYQIQDDYLDLYGNSTKIGKTLNKDKTSNKKNYSYYYKEAEHKNIIEIKEKEIYNYIEEMKHLENTYNIILSILKREK